MTTKKSGEEPFAVTATINGDASNGLPFLYHQAATADIPDFGKASVGMSANGAAIYVMLAPTEGKFDLDGPPRLFTLPLKELYQAAITAAVARHKTGQGIPAEIVEA